MSSLSGSISSTSMTGLGSFFICTFYWLCKGTCCWSIEKSVPHYVHSPPLDYSQAVRPSLLQSRTKIIWLSAPGICLLKILFPGTKKKVGGGAQGSWVFKQDKPFHPFWSPTQIREKCSEHQQRRIGNECRNFSSSLIKENYPLPPGESL